MPNSARRIARHPQIPTTVFDIAGRIDPSNTTQPLVTGVISGTEGLLLGLTMYVFCCWTPRHARALCV